MLQWEPLFTSHPKNQDLIKNYFIIIQVISLKRTFDLSCATQKIIIELNYQF